MRAHAAVLGAVVGALLGYPFPVWLCVLVVALVIALTASVPESAVFASAVMGLALLVVASTICARSEATIKPADAGSFEGWVTLLDDPRPVGPYSVRATARVANARMTLRAHGPSAGRLDDRLSGERVRVVGTIRPTDPDDDWSRWRHVTGRLMVDRIETFAAGSPVTRVANEIRRILARGAEALPEEQRALFLGMVIGDDRDQTPVVADDFRAAGLGHLLVVSGQNVAFVLALATPFLLWARPGVRLVILGALLLFFAVLTRFEPSVLRAVVMAAVGVGSIAVGRPVSGRRALSVAVTVLLLVDPFLVHVLAFRLSAAATAAIVWLSESIAGRLRGPMPLRVAFATTAAAQVGVAPLLLATFGPMPLATLPANLLAGPLSGPVMMWGFSAGMLAGVFGGVVAAVIHWPIHLMLSWIGGVAATAAAMPQAELGVVSVLAASAAMILAVLSRCRVASSGAVVILLLVCVMSLRNAPHLKQGTTKVDGGAIAHRVKDNVVVMLKDPGSPRRLLEGVRRAGVNRIDLIVASDGDLSDALAVIALTDRYSTVVVAPPMHRVPGAHTVQSGDIVRVGDAVVTVAGARPDLDVRVSLG